MLHVNNVKARRFIRPEAIKKKVLTSGDKARNGFTAPCIILSIVLVILIRQANVTFLLNEVLIN